MKEHDGESPGPRVIAILIWLVATVGAVVLLLIQASHDPVPSIVRFELAWHGGDALRILRLWGATGQTGLARSSIRIDYALIVAYTCAVAGLCLFGSRLAPGSRSKRSRLGRAVVAGVVAAGIFDVLEDVGMSRTLNSGTGRLASVVSALATAKFVFVGLGLIYGLLAACGRIARAAEAIIDREHSDTDNVLPGVAQSQTKMGSTARRDEHPVRPRPSSGILVLRWLVGLPLSAPFAPPDEAVGHPETTGISCSGGGIRSAAYNLGALQSFQREGVLKDADYLTAVSGGSYIAASYAMVTRLSDPPAHDPAVFAPGSPEEHFLKTHSAYLGPPGVAGKFWMVLRLLAGMTVNFGFVVVFLYLVARPIGWWYAEALQPGLHSSVQPTVSLAPWMWLLPTIVAGFGLLLVAGDLFTYPDDRRARLLRTWSIRLIDAAAIAFLLFVGLPWAIVAMIHLNIHTVIPKPQFTLPTAGLGAMIVGAVRGFVAKHKPLLALFAGAIIGPAVLVVSFLVFLRGAVGAGITASQIALWALVLGVFAIAYFGADLTSWSPHPFYERALWSAFGLHRIRTAAGPAAEVLKYGDNVPLDAIGAVDGEWPELIVCAAANISDEGATPPGRNATWFNFSSLEIGGPMGTVASPDFAKILGSRARDISLGSAVAISGAALSPSMGKMTKAPIRFLMALLNIRLGVWIPNPWWETSVGWWTTLHNRRPFWRVVRGRPRPRFLVKELMGWNHASSKFLYVTDGGHYENLGLIELLRRGCTLIYCLDASGDHEETFHTLGEAIALARTDLQVEIDVRPDPMRPSKDSEALTDFVVGKIRYPNEIDGKKVEGTLVYGKATVTKDAPWDVRDFRERDKRFPNHSTIDQFFNEQKFEAYRALGATTALRMAHWADPTRNQPASTPAAVVDLNVVETGPGTEGGGRRVRGLARIVTRS
jgi:hypothetical protein